MLKIAQEYAIKKLRESKINYKLIPTFTIDNKRVSDEIYVKAIPKMLKEKGYYLSEKPNRKGFFRLYQPTIAYSPNQSYGHTPDGFLED